MKNLFTQNSFSTSTVPSDAWEAFSRWHGVENNPEAIEAYFEGNVPQTEEEFIEFIDHWFGFSENEEIEEITEEEYERYRLEEEYYEANLPQTEKDIVNYTESCYDDFNIDEVYDPTDCFINDFNSLDKRSQAEVLERLFDLVESVLKSENESNY